MWLKIHLLLERLLLELLLIVTGGLHEAVHDVNRNRVDNGAIVLCRNSIQSFKILNLKREYFCFEDEWALKVIFQYVPNEALFLTDKSIPEALLIC